MLMFNLDLAGAEWVVVAYLANEPNMLEVVRSGKSPHVCTGSFLTGYPEDVIEREHKLIGEKTDPDQIKELRHANMPELFTLPHRFLPRSMSIRQGGKKSNHGFNYDMRYRRFALENEITEADAKPLWEGYNTVAYPGLPTWRDSIRQELRENDRTLENCFGRKVRLLDEAGPELFMAAYSFKPQSTVVDITNKALVLIDADRELPNFLGAQVHDSIMGQLREDTPNHVLGAQLLRIKAHMSPVLRYSGHEFVIGVDAKVGRDWSRMKGFKWCEDPLELGERIRAAVSNS
jgi:hypothetical protein